MVKRLSAGGRVRFADSSDDAVAEWRRVVDYAKQYSMQPKRRRIEKVPYGGRGLEYVLAEGPHPNARSQRPRPTTSSSVPVPVRVRNALRPDGPAWRPRGTPCGATATPGA
ncbi:hypothetical protein C3K23_17970 [Streptomyces sp. 604F]|nr:hypothetical protein C3K23_17970 [Streptomyces sp. 604F]